MVFRDDKDALDQRLGDLEADLKEAREGLDRKDEELRRLRERMGSLDKPPAPRRRPVGLLIGVVVVTVAAGAAFALVKTGSEPAPTVAMPSMPEPPPRPLPPAPPPAPKPAAPDPVPASPPAKPATPPAELTWKATVRSASGTFESVRAGTKCTVETLATGGAELDFHGIVVRCGDVALYDSAAPVKGTMMSQTSGSLRELPGPKGAYVYHLVYQDTGTRSLDARPQLEIGTERRIARVFHDGALGGAVDLTIDKDSQPRNGEPLFRKGPE